MRDPMTLAELVREQLVVSDSEDFGDLTIEGNTVVVWWRGGTPPAGVERLVDSEPHVIVRSCRYTHRELRDAVRSLVDGWHRLPFTMVSVGPLPGAAGVGVDVAEPELPQAQGYFAEQPLRSSPGGLLIEVRIEPTGYPPLVIHSLRPWSVDELERIDVDRYVGLPIDEATRRALEDGWLVCSFAEDAGGGLTLDLRRNRLDLCHDHQGTVIRADVG